ACRMVTTICSAARLPATSPCSRSRLPIMTVSRLLKSCARPPVRLPTASIFCDCCNCCSTARLSVMSSSTPSRYCGSPCSLRMLMRLAFTRRVPGAGMGASSSTSGNGGSQANTPPSDSPLRFPVCSREQFRGLLREQVPRSSPDDTVARYPPQHLGGAVDQHIALLAGVAHEDRARDILDDGVQELAAAVALLLEAPPVGHVVDDREQILRGAVVVADQQPPRYSHPPVAARHLDDVLVDQRRLPGFKPLAVELRQPVGGRLGQHLVRGPADHLAAGCRSRARPRG